MNALGGGGGGGRRESNGPEFDWAQSAFIEALSPPPGLDLGSPFPLKKKQFQRDCVALHKPREE